MNTIILTKLLLDEIVTEKGGYNKKQTEVFGITWPLAKGWKSSLIGKEITKELFNKYIKATNNKNLIEKYCPSVTEVDNTYEVISENLNPLIEKFNNVAPTRDLLNEKEQKILVPLKDKKIKRKEIQREQKRKKRVNDKKYIIEKMKIFGVENIKNILSPFYNSFSINQRLIYNSFVAESSFDDYIKISNMCKRYLLKKFVYVSDEKVNLSKFETATKKREKQYLYVIRDESGKYVKIGVAIHPKERLIELQTGCPFKLKISKVYYVEGLAMIVEKKCHSFFKKRNTSGEWFLDVTNEEIEKYITSLKIDSKEIPEELYI